LPVKRGAVARPLVVTRPEEPGRRLTAELIAAGVDTLWLPAFDLGPAPDPQRARQTLAQLAQFDLAVFVSPTAVDATAALLPRAWPATTTIGTVGAATERAVQERLPGAAQAPRVTVAGDGPSGSEALWVALQAREALPRRVLVLRAGAGRDWLLERLRAAGAQVQPLAVYRRSEHAPSAMAGAWLWQRAAIGPVASLVTSSEAVTALQRQCAGAPTVLAALYRGPALASHPRIGARLRAAGFADVRECELSVAAIAAQLR
jgi:uroporphyrinogen-III synthase